MADHNVQLKQLLKTQEKITTHQKLIEIQIRQSDQRLFKSTIDENMSVQVQQLTRKSVLEGMAKVLIKIKESTDKKIEALAHCDTDTDFTLHSSMDNSNSQSYGTSLLNLKRDKFAGPITELFTLQRNV
ncbi:uncharacterized protein LOC127701188 [Mytilus californianus]|uniref:uncharacterized protein LOC127701188 n=1 Tax=Mytilus californianus TaxID=6549 RepID=UPI002247E20F|nr:uncharacterized protein LOC127701188 [Mytilus californianus]